jgi:hypothetical protein
MLKSSSYSTGCIACNTAGIEKLADDDVTRASKCVGAVK